MKLFVLTLLATGLLFYFVILHNFKKLNIFLGCIVCIAAHGDNRKFGSDRKHSSGRSTHKNDYVGENVVRIVFKKQCFLYSKNVELKTFIV